MLDRHIIIVAVTLLLVSLLRISAADGVQRSAEENAAEENIESDRPILESMESMLDDPPMKFVFDPAAMKRMQDSEDFTVDNVMDLWSSLLFQMDENTTHVFTPNKSPQLGAEEKDPWDKMAEVGNFLEQGWFGADNGLDKLEDIIKNRGNASVDIINGNIVLNDVSDDMGDESDVSGSEGDMTEVDIQHTPEVTVNTTTSPATTVTVTTMSLKESQLLQLRRIVDAGFLEEKVYRDFESGNITADEIKQRLKTNHTFILEQFPPKFAEMLKNKDKRIPEEIHVIIFSGELPLPDLKWKVYENDDIVTALLPERLRDMLETREPPHELKVMLHNGDNSTEIMVQVMTNETLLRKIMSASMFYFYTLFQQPQKVAINMALSGIAIVALCCVMTSLGCTMTVTEIMKHVKRPKGVIIALVSQYGIMPAAAFGLTQLFDLETYPAIAVLICGCCPGGNLSNMLAFAINGDMNLSILMTTCSSVLGLGMMPLLLFCYSRFIIPIDGGEIVPFDKIILNVALTIVPVSLGIAIKHYRPSWTTRVMRFGAAMLLICSIAFGVLAGFLLGEKFFNFFPPTVVACAAILPMTGYIFGFFFARVAKENQKCSRTICVETGCQNVQLCGTVLKLAFDPILVGVMILLPLIYMCFQAGEAILLVCLYRLYEKCTGKKKDDEKSIESDDDEEKKLDRSDSDIKISKADEKPEKHDDEKKEETPANGVTKNDARDSKVEEALERWPLAGTPSPEFLDSFANAGKEKYA